MNTVYLVTKCFITNNNGEILILKRAASARVRPKQWDLPGGMVGEGENPNTAVLREIQEETTIIPASASILYISTENTPAYILTFFYHSKYVGEDIHLSDEHTAYKWVSINEFENLELPKKFRLASAHLHNQ